jgi:putative Mg2+ transporter-C (MgtC) family protein
MILSTHITAAVVATAPGFSRVTDPGRIAAQIVTGIGFLGAGAILKEGFTVLGLTTAASLWVAAAIGMSTGAGFYLLAAAVTGIALFALIVLHSVERIYQKDIYRDLAVTIANTVELGVVIDIVKEQKLHIIFFDLKRDYHEGTTTAKMALRLQERGDPDKLCHQVIRRMEEEGIPLKSVKWSHP